MQKLSLTACSFWIREKNVSKKNEVEIIKLNQTIKGKKKNYEDFFDVIIEFCNKYKNYTSIYFEEKVFKIDIDNIKIEEDEKNRYMFITIFCGGYGIDADIISENSKEVLYKRKKEHAEIIPYRVCFALPKGNDVCKGILIFQNIGQYGIKTITTKYLQEYIAKNMNDVMIIGNICPEVFIQKILECNGLKKVTFIRNNISNDKADEEIGYGKEERTITQFINLERWREKISGFFNSKQRIYEFENVNYNDFKLETSIYGRNRTVSVSNIENMSIIEGIPKDVLNEQGNIDDVKIKNHFKKVVNEYLEHMVYKKNKKIRY